MFLNIQEVPLWPCTVALPERSGTLGHNITVSIIYDVSCTYHVFTACNYILRLHIKAEWNKESK